MKTQPTFQPLPAAQTTPINKNRLSRRGFITSTSCVASAMAMPGIPAFAETHGRSASDLVASNFRREINSEFRAMPISANAAKPAESLSLKLSDVSAARLAHPDLSAEAAAENVFSLKFTVNALDGDKPLAQDTYWLSHSTLGEFAVLLVPTQGGRALRAEFHRL